MQLQSQLKCRTIFDAIRAAICASSSVIFAGSAMAVPANNVVAPVKKPVASSEVTITPSKKVMVKSAATVKAPAVPAVPAKKAIIKKEVSALAEEAEVETAEVAPVRKKVRSSEPPNEDPTKSPAEGSGIFTHETAHTLFLEAKQFMRHNNYNRAIRLLNKAIKLDDDNMEVRVLYAEALDEKLQHQAEKDPEIFNKCIKSWLMVARNEIGDEKGMTFKGLGIMSGQYGDEDWSLKAKKRLKVLTGYSPKPWETSDRYLRKVLRSADTSVSAVIKTSATDDEPVKIVNPKAKNEE